MYTLYIKVTISKTVNQREPIHLIFESKTDEQTYNCKAAQLKWELKFYLFYHNTNSIIGLVFNSVILFVIQYVYVHIYSNQG